MYHDIYIYMYHIIYIQIHMNHGPERSHLPASYSPSRNCNVMLGALKWLGLLCKSRTARLVLLLTGRVVLLADVATAYLERGWSGWVGN